VDKILAAKKQTPNANTSSLEKQIDELVYKLYELTEEEVSIVEDK
jgi:type II restriction/modification system DNA methylase subunit YeeA